MKGRLVSNTGPIIALSSIDHLEILKRIFEEVILPKPMHNFNTNRFPPNLEGQHSNVSRNWHYRWSNC